MEESKKRLKKEEEERIWIKKQEYIIEKMIEKQKQKKRISMGIGAFQDKREVKV